MLATSLSDNLPRNASGWATIAALAVGFAVLALVLRRFLPGMPWVRRGVLAVPVIAVAWWLGSPLFIDERVEEALPVTASEDAPVRVATGELRGIGHSAMGRVGLYRLAEGRHVVRFEDVDIQNGPDLFVYLVPEPGQEDDDGAVDLGRLKGNLGSHNYELPDGVDPDTFATVLVWCRQFGVPFANATLA